MPVLFLEEVFVQEISREFVHYVMKKARKRRVDCNTRFRKKTDKMMCYLGFKD